MTEPWQIQCDETEFLLRKKVCPANLLLAFFLLPFYLVVVAFFLFATVAAAMELDGAHPNKFSVVAVIGLIFLGGILVFLGFFFHNWFREGLAWERRLQRDSGSGILSSSRRPPFRWSPSQALSTDMGFHLSADRLARFTLHSAAGFTLRIHDEEQLPGNTFHLFGFLHFAKRRWPWFSSRPGVFPTAEKAFEAGRDLVRKLEDWIGSGPAPSIDGAPPTDSPSETDNRDSNETRDLFPWLYDPSVKPRKKGDDVRALKARLDWERLQGQLARWEEGRRTTSLQLVEGSTFQGKVVTLGFTEISPSLRLRLVVGESVEDLDVSAAIGANPVGEILISETPFYYYDGVQTLDLLVVTKSGTRFLFHRAYNETGRSVHGSVRPSTPNP